MVTVKQVCEGAALPQPVYVVKPYVVLSSANVILFAGTLAEVRALPIKFGNYFDAERVDIRTLDLYLTDNTKVGVGLPWPTIGDELELVADFEFGGEVLAPAGTRVRFVMKEPRSTRWLVEPLDDDSILFAVEAGEVQRAAPLDPAWEGAEPGPEMVRCPCCNGDPALSAMCPDCGGYGRVPADQARGGLPAEAGELEFDCD